MVKPADRFARRARRTRFALRQLGNGKPRLSVFRSNKHIYAQIIDDVAGRTLVAASSKDQGFESDKGSDKEAAKRVGMMIAERAKAANVETVVFDRGGYKYHGRVQALADGAREGGLKL